MEPLTFTDNKQVLDYRRLLARIVKYWYLVAISLLIALVAAYLFNRYSPRIFTVNMSILIKESQEAGSSAEILYNNPLINPYRNFYNELYILKSYPLVEKVIRDLNFGIRIHRIGNIKASEVYNSIPISVHIVIERAFPYSRTIGLEIISETSFRLYPLTNENNDLISDEFQFNDTIQFGDMSLVLNKIDNINLSKYYETEYNISFTDPRVLTRSYVSKLNAEWAEEGSSVIDLSINGLIPEKESDFFDILIQNYQLQDLRKKVHAAERSLEFIETQIKGISDSLFSYEGRIERFKTKNTGDLSHQGERLLIKLESLETNRGEMLIRKNYYEYLRNYIEAGENLDQAILPSSVGIPDPVLSSLVTQMMDLQLQVKLLESRDNPLVQNTFDQLNNIKRNILEIVKNLKSTDDIAVAQLNQEIKLVERELGHLPGAERNFISIQRSYNLSENLYIFLQQKRYEAGITMASTTSDIEVVNPPMLVGGPVSPKTNRNYLIAVMLGLGLPIGLLALLEILNNKISTKEDVEKLTRIPIIAGIGHKNSESNLVVNDKPKSAIAESFRSLRSDLNYFTNNKQKKIILVTSSIAAEGKTFTVINLATVVAYSGKKVLIIGADMRKPKIFNDLGLTNDFGLSNFLSQSMSFEETIQSSPIENIDLISGGPVPPNPSELLMKPEMSVAVNKAREKYDFVILDTPPVAIVTDAFVLSGFADHMLFITRQNYTPKQGVQEIDKLYQDARVKNISIVLNDIQNGGTGFGYGYGYGYGQGYYDEPSTGSKHWYKKFFNRVSKN